MQIEKPFLQIVSSQKKEPKTEDIKVNSQVNYNMVGNIAVQSQININTKSIVDEMLEQNKDASIYSIADKVASGEIKPDTKLAKTPLIDSSQIEVFTQEVKVQDLSASQIKKIKRTIFDLHHKTKPGGNNKPDPNKPDPNKPGTDPTKPGGKDPVDPDKPGTDPNKPGENGGDQPARPGTDPNNPGQDGGKDPVDPDNPGQEGGGKDPVNPDKPGTDPDKPGGNEGEDPGQEGGKDPVNPDKPGTDPDKPEKDPTPETKKDADRLFEYLNTQNPNVTKETGISRHDLFRITQNDDFEEKNKGVFGKINGLFNKINTNNDTILSYEEVCALLNDVTSQADLDQIYLAYDRELQAQFDVMNADERLEFAVKMAKEYFAYAGFDPEDGKSAAYSTESFADRRIALDRLLRENKFGHKDLNPGKAPDDMNGRILGAYTALINQETGEWISDDSPYIVNGQVIYDQPYDNGIWLDTGAICNPNEPWWKLVSTVIHEVTHSLAAVGGDTDIPNRQAHWDQYKNAANFTGEHIAYQTNEDYQDSIAHGDYPGSHETRYIDAHIKQNYTPQPQPDAGWGTYA